MGGPKALAQLAGKPLISYPLAALQDALQTVVVLAKEDTPLPDALDAEVWREPDEPLHPLAGILWALERARGQAVLVCAVDLPLVTPALVRRLAEAEAGEATAVLASASGQMQPLLGRYEPGALAALREPSDGVSMMAAVAALRPALVEVEDPGELLNVNTPGDLRQAEERAANRR